MVSEWELPDWWVRLQLLPAFATMREAGAAAGPLAIKIICLYFVAPAVIALLIHWGMKKIGWVKDGDMKLQP